MKIKSYKDAVMTKRYIKFRLNEIGLMNTYVGYYYIVDILDMLQTAGKVLSFSKEIYPKVAQKFCTKEHTVERNIRYLMNAYWDSVDGMLLRANAPNPIKKKCKTFIYHLFYTIFKDIMLA